VDRQSRSRRAGGTEGGANVTTEQDQLDGVAMRLSVDEWRNVRDALVTEYTTGATVLRGVNLRDLTERVDDLLRRVTTDPTE
jgi:hypothetical protein